MRSAIFVGVAVGCSQPAPPPVKPSAPVVDATPVTQPTPPTPNAKIPVAPPCTGWCWEGPQGNDLVAVWASARDDAWAVGEAGTVLHFDGTQWLPVPFPSKTRLVAVTGTARDKVWVGGLDGVYAWENGAFVKRAEGPTFAIAAEGNDVWAGSGNRLVHDAGNGFLEIDLPTGIRGRITAMTIDTNGTWIGIERATVQKYQTAAFALVRRDNSIVEYVMPPDMDQVIVEIGGGVTQSGQRAELFVRTSYPREWIFRGRRNSKATAIDRMWVANRYVPPPDPAQMRVLGRATTDTMTVAVGESGAISWSDGQQHDIRASTIERFGGLTRDANTNELVMVSAGGEVLRRGPDGFAELGDLARDRENAFVATSSIDGSLFAIRRRIRNDGFSPSHSELVKWFGTGWTKLHAAPNTRIESISARSTELIWMAGAEDKGAHATTNPRGVVLRYDGKNAKRIATNVGAIARIVAIDATTAWIAGEDGIAKLHVSGALTSITKLVAPVRDLWIDGDDLYAITQSQVVRVRGGKATPMTLPPIHGELRAIAGRSANDITIAADREVLHYDGTAWQIETTPSAEDFVGTIYAANGTAIIASLRGLVLAHPPR